MSTKPILYYGDRPASAYGLTEEQMRKWHDENLKLARKEARKAKRLKFAGVVALNLLLGGLMVDERGVLMLAQWIVYAILVSFITVPLLVIFVGREQVDYHEGGDSGDAY